MMNSRSLKELHPVVRRMAEDFCQACHVAGIEVIITSTYRDHESQDALYAQGRTTPGKIVTKAKGDTLEEALELITTLLDQYSLMCERHNLLLEQL